jgi:hypothetical protein
MTDPKVVNPRNSLLALFFLGILAVMLIPLPAFMLDLMLSINISISLLILMAVINAGRPIDFSTFPTVLLFTALFRLALNVASTRLILLEGDAGSVIRTFWQLRRRRPARRRRGGVPGAGGDPVHRHHQGPEPHQRGHRQVRARLDARQADVDRR